jgi:hypothetical protein
MGDFMLSVKNVSEVQKIWGGSIFAPSQQRAADADFKHYLSDDASFYSDILALNAEVYVDLVKVDNVILACEYIRSETKKDEEGNLYSRIKQVPEDYGNRAKSVLFTTGLSGSLEQEFWPLEQATECSLAFLREENGALVSCLDSEATYTKLVWAPPHKTMQSRAIISLPSTSTTIRGWVGVSGFESIPEGRLYMAFNFVHRNEWEISLMQPRALDAPFALLLRHGVGEQVLVELMFEYFTNFVTF